MKYGKDDIIYEETKYFLFYLSRKAWMVNKLPRCHPMAQAVRLYHHSITAPINEYLHIARWHHRSIGHSHYEKTAAVRKPWKIANTATFYLASKRHGR